VLFQILFYPNESQTQKSQSKDINTLNRISIQSKKYWGHADKNPL